MVLVGNKSDLTELRQVSKLEGEELAKNFQVPFLEASAKERRNIDEAFMVFTSSSSLFTSSSHFRFTFE
jgi:GTPase SAR1 family protein